MKRLLRLVGTVCGLVLLLTTCTNSEEQSDTLFELLPSSVTNIDFSNDLTVTDTFNIQTESNFLAGGGVALGDINNDGLLDIYLIGNQKKNKLYLNKGDFVFEDITYKAGVGGSKGWSTGASMVDIDGNGLLDIYVSNAGSDEHEDRRNELFINNGDGTFSERASEFGLDDNGNSIHAAFFDYDNDGDLDMYLVNNYSSQPKSRYELENNRREEVSFLGGDRLYRNEGESFIDVTDESGIYSSEIAFGLGVSIGDINQNGWMDMYVSNDFFERDYLYLNNGDGTFREVLEEKLSSISTTSMGGDIADLNNDGYPEIFVADMLPKSEERIKTITDFIDWDQYQTEIEMGYHRKFTRNTLHYNNADGTFSEIGRFSGVEASDWSWGALMADYDLDGLKDIFVVNGFYKDVSDKDFLLKTRQRDFMSSVIVNGKLDLKKLIDAMPTTPIANFMFNNTGGMQFSNSASEWGLDQPGFSHGSAYGDLNGDGSLDLVVNNVNMEAFVYHNRALEHHPERSWLQVELEGESPNTLGVGAKVELKADGEYRYAEQMPQRGFQSSMDPTLHIGLGEGVTTIDTLLVNWPDGRVSKYANIEARQRYVVRQSEASRRDREQPFVNASERESGSVKTLLDDVTEEVGFDWKHEESVFNDFTHSPMLFNMRSTEGPPLCIGDINGDGREDFYVGGAAGQPGALFTQNSNGGFSHSRQPALQADSTSEDTACLFFDATGDGLTELYVASGSSEFTAGNPNLADRLYRVNREGSLVRSEQALPRPRGGHQFTSIVREADVDGNGTLDLFIGTRMSSQGQGDRFGYGVPVGGYVLVNNGSGIFEDATDEIAPELRAEELRAAGVTDASWGDINGDGLPDLMVVGEWMPITIFYNSDGMLERRESQAVGFGNTHGWWQSLTLADLNGNGRLDFVAGNHGLNSRFRATPEQPVEMWVGDFDRNGTVEQLFTHYNDGGPFPLALRHELLQQFPYLQSRIRSYADYGEMTIHDIFPERQLQGAEHYQVDQLASVVGWNNGDGSFRLEQLPFRAQLTPIYSILAADINADGNLELLLGGNLNEVRPQMGPYDAGNGLLLRQDSIESYQEVSSIESGFRSEGDIRSIQTIFHNEETLILVSRNNRGMQIFKGAK